MARVIVYHDVCMTSMSSVYIRAICTGSAFHMDSNAGTYIIGECRTRVFPFPFKLSA